MKTYGLGRVVYECESGCFTFPLRYCLFFLCLIFFFAYLLYLQFFAYFLILITGAMPFRFFSGRVTMRPSAVRVNGILP